MSRILKTIVGAAVAVALASPVLALPIFAPHRAAYDLALDPALVGADRAPINGRMVMELVGSSCEGYTSTVRFVTQSNNERGRLEIIDARSTTFEMNGVFRFDDQRYSNNRLTQRTTGTVTRGTQNSLVALTRPTNKTLTVGGSIVFPVEQLQAIVQAATEGKHFVPLDVYDGAEGGETVYTTATVIGPATSTATGDVLPISEAGLSDLRSWPTTISYYKKSVGDSPPSIIMSFVLYENGIGRSLKIDQGNIVLVGTLTDLELLPASACVEN
jgi:hypothetical protein